MKKRKRITVKRFEELSNLISVINTICHDEEDVLVTDSKSLTKKLLTFKKAVKEFEKETGYILQISIDDNSLKAENIII